MVSYLVRLLLVLRKDNIYPGNPRAWRIAFCACLLCFSSAWGLLSCYSYITYGFASWNSLLLTFCVLGISFGAIVSLTPRPLYLYCHVLPLLVPPIFVDIYLRGQGYGLALINLVCLAFLLVQGKQLSAQYRKAHRRPPAIGIREENGRSRQRSQERLPGEHEPRVADAHERDHRDDGAGA